MNFVGVAVAVEIAPELDRVFDCTGNWGKLGFKRDAKLPAAWQAEDLWDEVVKIQVPVFIMRGSITRAFTAEV